MLGDPELPSRAILVRPTASGGTAFVLGVEHLSPTAAALVRQQIRGRRPDCVMLELDLTRARALGLQIDPAVRVAYPQRGGFPGLQAIAFLALASVSTSGVSEIFEASSYGGEFLAAAAAAREVNAEVLLGDRDLLLTLQRADVTLSGSLALIPCALGGIHTAPGYVPPPRLLGALLLRAACRQWVELGDSLSDIARDSDAQNAAFAFSVPGRTLAAYNARIIDVVARGSATARERRALGVHLQKALAAIESAPELTGEMPAAITSERDILLAHAVRRAPGDVVVAVVGRGHLEGIARHMDAAAQDEEAAAAAADALLRPPPFATSRAVATPLALLAAVGLAGRSLRHSPIAFRAFVCSNCAVLAAGALFAQRTLELRDRVHTALSNAV